MKNKEKNQWVVKRTTSDIEAQGTDNRPKANIMNQVVIVLQRNNPDNKDKNLGIGQDQNVVINTPETQVVATSQQKNHEENLSMAKKTNNLSRVLSLCTLMRSILDRSLFKLVWYRIREANLCRLVHLLTTIKHTDPH